MNFKIVFLVAVILLTLIGSMVSSPCFAQDNTGFSSAEDVALVFYKTAGIKPDFRDWAKKNKEFRYKSVTEAQNYIEQENQRLSEKWQQLDIKGTILTARIFTKGMIKLSSENTETKEPSYDLHILFENPDDVFFAYKFQETDFAIIPENITKILRHRINNSSLELMLKNLKLNSNTPISIEIGFVPTKSYTDRPEKINDSDQWVLIAKIVTMKVSTKNSNVVLWHYDAPWYMSPKRQELNDVYDEKREKTNQDNEEFM